MQKHATGRGAGHDSRKDPHADKDERNYDHAPEHLPPGRRVLDLGGERRVNQHVHRERQVDQQRSIKAPSPFGGAPHDPAALNDAVVDLSERTKRERKCLRTVRSLLRSAGHLEDSELCPNQHVQTRKG